MAALAILLVATGCTRTVAGQAHGGEPAPGADSFFQGGPPDYGQKLDAQEATTLTYARALRRVDPCGFAAGLKEFGDPGQVVGDFQICYASVKVTGDPSLTEVSYEYSMQDKRGDSAAFRVGSVPVYATGDECGYEVPLGLERLPGAPSSPTLQAMMSVSAYLYGSEEYSDPDCRIARQVVTGIVKQLPSGLQPRSALSAYPIKLAERDPCEILAEYPGKAREVSIDLLGDPFGCDFVLPDADINYTVRLTSSVDDFPDAYTKSTRDGVTYFQNEDPSRLAGCHALALVGDPLYPRDIGGGAANTDADAYFPAVVASAYTGRDRKDCGHMREILDKAVRLFAKSAR
ncbi:hypothetical protein [Mycobacteroides immunogenum]|uniref:DUF3558 domain-containing protein n=1 Tax=Mycobacteroides immunogenum TaxID=83262 RepID=A0A7V8RX22_9MYCO|nr:hypothetical protein [Mycobacteroides immunogenum]AMT69333.1 hypothetical protein ABG82_02195 [Mycobacteroides immunogenum]ANO02370.1 hypothetical protein BAB75_02195 [Mycobacteroides immunogenum]KIU39592.1 hypothetical protein TL11_15905 [Mycobacteroides immunogenum]KPG08484.1 hypothetical protein AN909_14275 [Mycobacteroides immunogenum]KPG08737.1 hypothetical protein AN910_17580 [Mycobacteroides immunogenum]